MRLESAVCSRPGVDKIANDDAFLNDVEQGVFAVADGVGSTVNAAESSRIAIETVQCALGKRLCQVHNGDSAEMLRDSVRSGNTALFLAGEKEGRRMLSTMTLAHIRGTSLSLAHCGDSRAYLLDEHALLLLTQDHTYIKELQRKGFLTEAAAEDHPRRNALSACLGQYEQARIDVWTTEITAQWFSLLLCSDGVSSHVSQQQMTECLTEGTPIKQTAQHLVEMAVRNGSNDDATVIVVRRRAAVQHN